MNNKIAILIVLILATAAHATSRAELDRVLANGDQKKGRGRPRKS